MVRRIGEKRACEFQRAERFGTEPRADEGQVETRVMRCDDAPAAETARLRQCPADVRSAPDHPISNAVNLGRTRWNADAGPHQRRPTPRDAFAVDRRAGDLDNAVGPRTKARRFHVDQTVALLQHGPKIAAQRATWLASSLRR